MLEIALLNAAACINITYSTPHPKNYRWVSVVTKDPYSLPDHKGDILVAPYIDPPPLGYDYQTADTNIFYYDDASFESGIARHNIEHPKNRGEDFIAFLDCPTDSRLVKEETVDFITCLININTAQSSQCVNWSLTSTKRLRINSEDTLMPRHIQYQLMPR